MEYAMVILVASLSTFVIMGVYPDEKTCKTAFEQLQVGLTAANPGVEVGCWSLDDVKQAQAESKKKEQEENGTEKVP